MQDVCGAGVYSGGLTYIALTTTHKERPVYFSGVIAVWGTGCILGLVIGGAFAESGAGWIWAFWINLIVAAITLPAMLLCLPQHQPVRLAPDQEAVFAGLDGYCRSLRRRRLLRYGCYL